MKTLYIDTTSNQEVIISLLLDKTKDTIRKPLERQKAQVVLQIVESLLEKHGLTIHDLDSIEVNPGPGSFTGVRVGVAIANALSFALHIPVNNILVSKDDTVVEPLY